MNVNWKQALKRSLILMLAAACLLGVVPMLNASAADPGDVQLTECPMIVQLSGENEAWEKNLDGTEAKLAYGADVVIDLYQVAKGVQTDWFDIYDFELNPSYKGSMTDDEAKKVLDQDAEALAAFATDIARQTDINPEVTGKKLGEQFTVDGGLYLMVLHGNMPTGKADDTWTKADYFKDIDVDGNPSTVTVAYSANFEYRFKPQLISIPTREQAVDPDSEGNVPWIGVTGNRLIVNLKAERERRLGNLEIVKTLDNKESKEDAIFVFDIEATLTETVGEETKTETVYANVVSINFTAPGSKSVVIPDLPVDTVVTVKETYHGATYVNVSTVTPDPVTIEAKEIVPAAVVDFENDYEEYHRGGHGITNNFSFDGAGNWSWRKVPDNSNAQ